MAVPSMVVGAFVRGSVFPSMVVGAPSMVVGVWACVWVVCRVRRIVSSVSSVVFI